MGMKANQPEGSIRTEWGNVVPIQEQRIVRFGSECVVLAVQEALEGFDFERVMLCYDGSERLLVARPW